MSKREYGISQTPGEQHRRGAIHRCRAEQQRTDGSEGVEDLQGFRVAPRSAGGADDGDREPRDRLARDDQVGTPRQGDYAEGDEGEPDGEPRSGESNVE